ncbi:nuclear transport factor 2 family protein [Streptomyces griseoruber]
MTQSPTSAPAVPADDTATVELAEAAWLAASDSTDPEASRRLMHPDCRVLHSLPGRIDGVEDFLRYRAHMGQVTGTRTSHVTVREFGDMAIVTCVQQFYVVPSPAPDVIPLAVQAAVTRVWVQSEAGWRLANLQMARRQLPG